MNLSKNVHLESYFSCVYFSSLPICYSPFKFLVGVRAWRSDHLKETNIRFLWEGC